MYISLEIVCSMSLVVPCHLHYHKVLSSVRLGIIEEALHPMQQARYDQRWVAQMDVPLCESWILIDLKVP